MCCAWTRLARFGWHGVFSSGGVPPPPSSRPRQGSHAHVAPAPHSTCRPDATLKELSQLLKDVVPSARRRNARLDFSLVYPGPEGRIKMRPVGTVRNTNRSPDDARTLRDLRYQVRNGGKTVTASLRS